jgi:hypothetical protein
MALTSAEQCIGRHATILQMNLDNGAAANAHLVFVLPNTVPWSVLIDDKPRYAPRATIWVGDGKNGVVRSHRTAGVPLLLTVQHVLFPVALRTSLHRTSVGAGLLFREAERNQLFPGSDSGEVSLLLFICATDQDGERTQCVDGEPDSHTTTGPGEFLDDKT